MNELALFAGACGGILGGKLLGWKTVCAVEFDEHALNVLIARQNDRSLEPFPIWDDVRTFDGKPWGGIVDVVSGGFPCQDISIAGKGAGLSGSRSGLWSEMWRIIGEVRPRFAFVENSPMLTRLGLGTVLGNLSEIRYNAIWGVFRASDIGAPHTRERIFILGCNTDKVYANREIRPERTNLSPEIWSAAKEKQEGSFRFVELGATDVVEGVSSYSEAVRVLHGMGNRVDRLNAIGNGQVPAVVFTAWNQLTAGALHYSLQQTHGGQSVNNITS